MSTADAPPVHATRNALHSSAPATVKIESDANSSSESADSTSPSSALRLPSNVAAALSYAAAFVTAVAFLMSSRYRNDNYVRFHAWQSLLFSLAYLVVWIPLTTFVSTLAGGLISQGSSFLFWTVSALTGLVRLVGLAAFAYWAFLLYRAFRNNRYSIPVIGKCAAMMAARDLQSPRG
jgi:uncharacterized membrane protein